MCIKETFKIEKGAHRVENSMSKSEPDLTLEWLRLRQAAQTIKTVSFLIEGANEKVSAATLKALADEVETVAKAGMRRLAGAELA